jgi:polysaccharide biosynthesis protein PslA
MYQARLDPDSGGHLHSTAWAAMAASHAGPWHLPKKTWGAPAKRATDIVFALVLVVLFSPVMLLAALAIRLESRGPILFRQRRVGRANIDFEMLKFRTMHHHPPERGRCTQTTRDDPRVTRVGAILRHTSLDELPQLFNVLRGDMSMVGPRPHAPGTCIRGRPFEEVAPNYSARHCVRPGMTGLAQVRGLRGGIDSEDRLLGRVAADLEYIERRSLWLDFVILVRTAGSVLIMRNAY